MSTSVASWRFTSRLCNFLINSLEAKVGPGKKSAGIFFPLLSREFFSEWGKLYFPHNFTPRMRGKKEEGRRINLLYLPSSQRDKVKFRSVFEIFEFRRHAPFPQNGEREEKSPLCVSLFFHACVWDWDGTKKTIFFSLFLPKSSSVSMPKTQAKASFFTEMQRDFFMRKKVSHTSFPGPYLFVIEEKYFVRHEPHSAPNQCHDMTCFPWQRPLLIRETEFGQHNS